MISDDRHRFFVQQLVTRTSDLILMNSKFSLEASFSKPRIRLDTSIELCPFRSARGHPQKTQDSVDNCSKDLERSWLQKSRMYGSTRVDSRFLRHRGAPKRPMAFFTNSLKTRVLESFLFGPSLGMPWGALSLQNVRNTKGIRCSAKSA